jgi:hypothetical protein
VQAQGGGAEVQLQPIRNLGDNGQRHTPAALPSAKIRYAFYMRMDGPGRVRKISPRLGLHPRTVKSAASRYTDCVIPTVTNLNINKIKYKRNYLISGMVLL